MCRQLTLSFTSATGDRVPSRSVPPIVETAFDLPGIRVEEDVLLAAPVSEEEEEAGGFCAVAGGSGGGYARPAA